jgi:hypothetical protein
MNDTTAETGQRVGALLRAGEHAGAEAVLLAKLAEHPGAVADACRAVSMAGVEVSGWDELNADLTRLVRRAHDVTAVGLNLSNYNDADGEWWDKEPAVEFAAYSDRAYPFSTTPADVLREAGAAYPAPWTGRMLGDEDAYPAVHGLRALNGLLLRTEADSGRDDVLMLGGWWMHLRFHQAVVRHLDARGLALAVPVVMGSHDCGPWVAAVHYVTRVGDHLATTQRLLAEQTRAQRVYYDSITDETIAELRGLREGSRGWALFDRARRRTFVEFADLRVASLCRGAELPAPSRSITRMTDAEFEEIVTGYLAFRQNRPGAAVADSAS